MPTPDEPDEVEETLEEKLERIRRKGEESGHITPVPPAKNFYEPEQTLLGVASDGDHDPDPS